MVSVQAATLVAPGQIEIRDYPVPAPNRACGVCRNCRRGFPYYLCRKLENYGNSLSCAEPPHLFGGWAEFIYLRPGTPVFRVPQDLPSEVAILTEIFAVTHRLERAAAIRRPGGFLPGDTVAVVGVGSLGMAHLVKAALMGAGRVIAVDKSARRLALAQRLVNAGTVAVGRSADGPDNAVRAQVMDMTDGEGADVVVNATGFPGSFSLAASMVRDAGTILEVGAFVDMGPEAFNPAAICGRSLTVMGTGGEDPQAYDGTIALLTRHAGAIPFAEMISHTFRIADAALAIETSLDADHATKVLISNTFGLA